MRRPPAPLAGRSVEQGELIGNVRSAWGRVNRLSLHAIPAPKLTNSPQGGNARIPAVPGGELALEVHPEFIHDEMLGKLDSYTSKDTGSTPPGRMSRSGAPTRTRARVGGPFTIPRLTRACEPGTLALVRIEC